MTLTHHTATIAAHDGGQFSAHISRPTSNTPVGAIVVIQEIFGVNAVMRGICDTLAKAGYIAICPDLFWRQKPGIQLTDQSEDEWQQAFALYNGFDVDLGIEDLKSTLAHARALEGCTGKAGTIGYCLGGRLAYLMACRSDADCNVSYYGVALDEHLNEASAITTPLLMHVAALDKFVPAAAREKIIATFKDSPLVDVHVYEGVNHAFARVGGEHYDEAAAQLANQRSADFIAQHLG